MGRRAARATHLALSILGAALFLVFVIPRWWVLTGDIPASLAVAGRIAAGVPIAAAAVPVALSLQRSLNPELKIPELALRLRAWSAVLHVVGGMLMVAAAVAEIWLNMPAAGPWLFAVYGAAGAIAALGVLAFALSFAAEEPPGPPKPAKPAAAKKPRWPLPGRGKDGGTTGAGEAGEATPETTDEPDETDTESPDETPGAGLRNKRPTGKSRLRSRR